MGPSVDSGMLTRRHVVENLRGLGVGEGDHLLVHSSLRAVGAIDGGADALLDGLLDAVGPNGTLAMPAFNYSRPEVLPHFDPASTPGRTGALSEIFRARPGTLRSLHPSHSVVASGERAAEFLADHMSRRSVGVDSPIDRLAQAGGVVLLLGVTHMSNTTVHVGEEHAG